MTGLVFLSKSTPIHSLEFWELFRRVAWRQVNVFSDCLIDSACTDRGTLNRRVGETIAIANRSDDHNQLRSIVEAVFGHLRDWKGYGHDRGESRRNRSEVRNAFMSLDYVLETGKTLRHFVWIESCFIGHEFDLPRRYMSAVYKRDGDEVFSIINLRRARGYICSFGNVKRILSYFRSALGGIGQACEFPDGLSGLGVDSTSAFGKALSSSGIPTRGIGNLLCGAGLNIGSINEFADLLGRFPIVFSHYAYLDDHSARSKYRPQSDDQPRLFQRREEGVVSCA